ncbi:hypothetical protein bcere0026_2360 [Bacillus mycoides]|uniref:Uncharacterized protein n=1 Tax=Bacillus mycoides TaxID=1405 RepID=C2XNJ3_BACMY|nr:hypothetical protein bcere0026_2360 [Bacillus mycoides]
MSLFIERFHVYAMGAFFIFINKRGLGRITASNHITGET